jgi:hypothetical protein
MGIREYGDRVSDSELGSAWVFAQTIYAGLQYQVPDIWFNHIHGRFRAYFLYVSLWLVIKAKTKRRRIFVSRTLEVLEHFKRCVTREKVPRAMGVSTAKRKFMNIVFG